MLIYFTTNSNFCTNILSLKILQYANNNKITDKQKITYDKNV